MIVVIGNRPLRIDKWDHSKGNRKYRHQKRIVDHNGNDASHNHEKQRRGTGNGKLISFAGLFERVLDSSQFHCDLAGLFLTFPRQHLVAQCLFRRDKAHEIPGNAFGCELQKQNSSDCKQ